MEDWSMIYILCSEAWCSWDVRCNRRDQNTSCWKYTIGV